MNIDAKIIAEKLNELVAKNSDAEKGFKRAAELSEAKPLANWFATQAKNRASYKEELAAEIHALGYACVRTPSLTGDFHRAWMHLKAIFSADNDDAMLEEAIRGEKAALNEYNEVIAEENLPSSTGELLKLHRTKIAHSLATLQTMIDMESREES